MIITFYHTHWCPRCRRAFRHLEQIGRAMGGFDIERIDVLRQPIRAWTDGIRMIPALSCGGETLSGITLSREAIQSFLAEQANNSTSATERK